MDFVFYSRQCFILVKDKVEFLYTIAVRESASLEYMTFFLQTSVSTICIPPVCYMEYESIYGISHDYRIVFHHSCFVNNSGIPVQ